MSQFKAIWTLAFLLDIWSDLTENSATYHGLLDNQQLLPGRTIVNQRQAPTIAHLLTLQDVPWLEPFHAESRPFDKSLYAHTTTLQPTLFDALILLYPDVLLPII